MSTEGILASTLLFMHEIGAIGIGRWSYIPFTVTPRLQTKLNNSDAPILSKVVRRRLSGSWMTWLVSIRRPERFEIDLEHFRGVNAVSRSGGSPRARSAQGRLDPFAAPFDRYSRIAVVHYIAVTGASRDRVLTVPRLAAARQREDYVAVAFTRPAQRAQPVDDRARKRVVQM